MVTEGNPDWQVRHQKNVAGASFTDITSDVISADVRESISNDTEDVTYAGYYGVTVPVSGYEGSFNYGDIIEVSLGRGATKQVVMSGPVQEVNSVINTGMRRLVIKGVSWTQVLNDTTCYGTNSFFDYGTQPDFGGGDYNAASHKVVIWLINKFASSYGLTTVNVSATTDATNAGNQWDFVSFNMHKLGDAIMEVSKHKYTGDGDYVFWVDNNKDVHFIKKPTTVSTDVVEEGNDWVLDMDIRLKVWQQANVIIVYLGPLPDDNNYVVGWNGESISKVGMKVRFYSKTNFWADASKYGDGLSWTGAQKATEARRRGRLWADAMAKRGSPTYQGNITLRGNIDYTVGNLIELRSASMAWGYLETRIYGINHKFSNAGYTTTLVVKEDLPT